MSDKAKAILEAVARASSKVMQSADKALPPHDVCPNCGYTQQNRADTDLASALPDPNQESSYDK